MKHPAQGWYRDPYEIHRDRYFSAGQATKLVRDSGGESYDPPPDRPLPEGDLIPVVTTGEAGSGDDLHRADDGSQQQPYTPYDVAIAVTDATGSVSGGRYLDGFFRDLTDDR